MPFTATLPMPDQAPARHRLITQLFAATLAVGVFSLLLTGLLIWPGAVPEPLRPPVRVLIAALTLALVATMLFALLRLRSAMETRDATAARQQQLFDAMPTGLALWGADGRLVLCNADFRRLYAPLADVLQPGVHFESAMQRAVDLGLVPDATGHEVAWLAERLAQHREPGPAMLRQTSDGRWRRILEQRLPDGSLLGHSIDVTELVVKERALDAARRDAELAHQRLQDAIEALPAGFELYDADDRLVLINEVNLTLYPRLADLARRDPPPSFEEVIRAHHARGGLPQLPDADTLQAWLDRRQTERRSLTGGAVTPREAQTADGRWVRSHEQRTREGGVVGIRIDITELMQRDQALRQLNTELDRANAELRQLSETDALTDLANRRLFDRRLAEECARATRHGLPLALAVIDIDYFKRYNDRHGHLQGDECLRQVAALLRDSARRPADLAARLGGEEFALLLPHDSAADAAATAERLRQALARAALAHGDSPVSGLVTVSIGVAACGAGTPRSAHELLAAADAALYRAKQTGRDRALVAAAPAA